MKANFWATNWLVLIIPATLVLMVGCQSLQAERKTVSMADCLSDIQYRQVIDNLALLADRPGSLPYFVLAESGKTIIQATDQASIGLAWNLFTVAGTVFNKTLFSNANPGLGYIQQDQLEWDGTPALDPVQELIMRGLYSKALGVMSSPAEQIATEAFFLHEPPPFNDANVGQVLKAVQEVMNNNGLSRELAWSLANYKPAYSHSLREIYERINSGSVHIGHCLDVPKDACYVGKHGHTYVWVMREDMAVLTNLTIAVLDVASTDIGSQQGKTSKQASPKTLSAPAGLSSVP